MSQKETTMSLLNDGNGYLVTEKAVSSGVNPVTLKRMEETGMIERVAHGLYIGADVIPDPFFIAQYRCPKGVFSHETALFFNGFSDRTPFQLMITIPSGWNTRLISNDDVLIFYSKPIYMDLGINEKITSFGHKVSVYNIERTLCDCLRSIDKLDKDLILTALKRFMKDPVSNKALLLEYAATFKIRDSVVKYMEVLS